MTPTMNEIAEAVGCAFGVEPSLITAQSQGCRTRDSAARPRFAAFHLCREYTDKSFESIGGFFGGRHYSSVMHGVTRACDLKATDPDFAEHTRRASDLLKAPTFFARTRATFYRHGGLSQ